jgi:hypothetical protein
MRELQRGARKDAMIPTGRRVDAEEAGADVGVDVDVGVNAGLSQDSVEMVNTPSIISTLGCSLAPRIFRKGEASANPTRARSKERDEYRCMQIGQSKGLETALTSRKSGVRDSSRKSEYRELICRRKRVFLFDALSANCEWARCSKS